MLRAQPRLAPSRVVHRSCAPGAGTRRSSCMPGRRRARLRRLTRAPVAPRHCVRWVRVARMRSCAGRTSPTTATRCGLSTIRPATHSRGPTTANPPRRRWRSLRCCNRPQTKGLNPEDYDASRWAARISQLGQPGADARFDVALTVCVMRFSSDLEVGRVNPRHFKFAIAGKTARYDLQQFVRQRLVSGADPRTALEEIEPQLRGYKWTEAALQHYLQLAQQDPAEPLPVPAKTLAEGASYAAAAPLARRLQLLGDLPADSPVPTGRDLPGTARGGGEALPAAPRPHRGWTPGCTDRQAAEHPARELASSSWTWRSSAGAGSRRTSRSPRWW